MNNDYLVKQSTLSNIANSIREKTGSTEPMTVNEMALTISQLSTGGGDIVKGIIEIPFGTNAIIPNLIGCSNCVIIRNVNPNIRASGKGDVNLIIVTEFGSKAIFGQDNYLNNFNLQPGNHSYVSFDFSTGEIDVEGTDYCFSQDGDFSYTYIGW